MVVGMVKVGQEVPPGPILLDPIMVFVRKKGELGDMEGKSEMFFAFGTKEFSFIFPHFSVTISKTNIRLLSV